jgi:hypothetical protein
MDGYYKAGRKIEIQRILKIGMTKGWGLFGLGLGLVWVWVGFGLGWLGSMTRRRGAMNRMGIVVSVQGWKRK